MSLALGRFRGITDRRRYVLGPSFGCSIPRGVFFHVLCGVPAARSSDAHFALNKWDFARWPCGVLAEKVQFNKILY